MLIKIIIVILVLFFLLGLDSRIQISKYSVRSKKLRDKIKIALVTDLHSCKYKDDQQEIYNLIQEEGADLIFLSGDIIDDKLPMEKGFRIIENFSKLCPTYYVLGNHEIRTKKVNEIKNRMENMGIKVISGKIDEIQVNGNSIAIMGIDEPLIGDEYFLQKSNLENYSGDKLKLLIAHRPERFDDYRKISPDFVFSGHAHGGQWRLPIFLENGLLAPNQGFFPKYTKAVHEISESTSLVVSRGLSRESTRIFRFYNRPELVFVTIEN